MLSRYLNWLQLRGRSHCDNSFSDFVNEYGLRETTANELKERLNYE